MVHTVTAHAAQAGSCMGRTLEVRMHSSMAAQALSVRLLWRGLSGIEDLAHISAAIDVRLARPMTAFAGHAVATVFKSQHRMGIRRKAAAFSAVARRAGLFTNVAGCRAAGYAGAGRNSGLRLVLSRDTLTHECAKARQDGEKPRIEKQASHSVPPHKGESWLTCPDVLLPVGYWLSLASSSSFNNPHDEIFEFFDGRVRLFFPSMTTALQTGSVVYERFHARCMCAGIGYFFQHSCRHGFDLPGIGMGVSMSSGKRGCCPILDTRPGCSGCSDFHSAGALCRSTQPGLFRSLSLRKCGRVSARLTCSDIDWRR